MLKIELEQYSGNNTIQYVLTNCSSIYVAIIKHHMTGFCCLFFFSLDEWSNDNLIIFKTMIELCKCWYLKTIKDFLSLDFIYKVHQRQ